MRYYDELIALGGRPTRPIHSPFPSKVTMVNGMFSHRNEIEKIDAIAEVDATSDEDGRAARHWIEESNKWGEDLLEWKNFKESQLKSNQLGRTELELELENTDVDLVDPLSKLNDWQDFHLVKQRKVYAAGLFHEKCQEAITKSQNATPVASDAGSKDKTKAPFDRLMWEMKKSQKLLETSQEKLMWIESQWTEVLAEASHSIAGEPKLQKQLEDKLEKQANAIYRRIQQLGARASHAIHPPNESADFPQRLQYWISESSNLTAEMWDWKVFMAWLRRAKGTDTEKEEEQKQPAQAESCPELFEDLVKYCQHKLDEVSSWVDCWQFLARQDPEAEESTSSEGGWPCLPTIRGNDDDDDDEKYYYEKDEVTKAAEAQFYAQQAEQEVPKAAERLERSKRDLQSILALDGRPSTSIIPEQSSSAQLPPTPPKSECPETLPKYRRLSNKGSSDEKGHRRLKKEQARKDGAKIGNTNTKQQPLPTFSLGPSKVEEAKDIEMSDVSEDPRLAEAVEDLEGSECDTVMSDVEDPPNHTLPSSESHPRPTTDTKSRKSPSPGVQAPTWRKTPSATKFDRVISGGISKNTIEKIANFTKQRTRAFLNATTGFHSRAPIPPRRSERLKQKTTASAAISPPMSLPQSNAVESSQPSRQKKRKVQSDAVKTPETSRQKKRKV